MQESCSLAVRLSRRGTCPGPMLNCCFPDPLDRREARLCPELRKSFFPRLWSMLRQSRFFPRLVALRGDVSWLRRPDQAPGSAPPLPAEFVGILTAEAPPTTAFPVLLGDAIDGSRDRRQPVLGRNSLSADASLPEDAPGADPAAPPSPPAAPHRAEGAAPASSADAAGPCGPSCGRPSSTAREGSDRGGPAFARPAGGGG